MTRGSASRAAVGVGWKLGLLLGGFAVINHSLEVFAHLRPPLPAIRGVAMWAVTFLVCGAASSFTDTRVRDVPLGVAASVLAAVTSAAILVCYAIAVGIVRDQPLALDAILITGGTHVAGSVVVGLLVGSVSGCAGVWLRSASRHTAMGAGVGVMLVLATGLGAIFHATVLERSARPPFIMFGLPAIATALAVAAPVMMTLRPPTRGAARAS